ncbi:2-phosphoglycerate kinase [Deinobacterium chartae]|uniref:2-phosphoglycerate kinase n=1 Tax=Deinobacterium chartae TaxID=521158 RepID=A0A841I2N7_9DEIO|nr:2-phosphoglycerate kinase [Deinobacterium chartae]
MREIFVSSGQHRWPFSKGLVIESLLNAGVDQEAGAAIARNVEQYLLDTDQRVITPDELKALVSRFARELLGADFGQRFAAQTPTFEDINVVDGGSRLPFSRGILARSLEGAGLMPKQAYAVAKEVDRRLRQSGVHELPLEQVERLTEEVLEELIGHAAREAYLARYHQRGLMAVVDEGGVTFPFSKGILAQSLLATGLSPALAHRIARETELRLRQEDLRAVPRHHLRALVEEILRREIGDDMADRYRLLRAIRRPQRPIIILIGGVTGTGKSFLASEIAYRLGITRVVSTDSVREVMRAMVSPALLPALHASTFDAWHALFGGDSDDRPDREQLLLGFREQVQQVSVGLEAIVTRSAAEHTSLVVEGVHLVPGFLMSKPFENAVVVPMVVTVPDAEEHRKHFYSRDQETRHHRPMQRYLRHFSEIRALQDYVRSAALENGVPLLDGLSLDRAAEQAIEVIAQRVLGNLTALERATLED